MREMVDDYTRQLELRQETIKRLESDVGAPAEDPRLRQEVEGYKQENRLLRDKVNQLTREVEMGQQANGNRQQQLAGEADRLSRQLLDKDRQLERLEKQMAEQKSEWAGLWAT